MRELRDHVPGDPFKRIAWKASARRGRLLVREMEREERDVVWLVLDASVELWAGAPGEAPLDHAIDEVASDRSAAPAPWRQRRARRHGLAPALVGRDRPAGPRMHRRSSGALASAASCIDADRSELDEAEVARRVAEHARPLDPRGLTDLRKGDLDVARRARRPAARRARHSRPAFRSRAAPREQSLRHYLAAFGIESPPRLEGEREKAELTIAQVLERLVTEKPRASIVHVWAPAPTRAETAAHAIATLRRRRIEVRWTLPPYEAGVGSDDPRRNAVADVVEEAVRVRARATRARGERILRRLGVRVHVRALRAPAAPVAPELEATP